MLRTMRRGSRWIMWVVILGVGAVFVLYLGIGGSFSPAAAPETVVAVGGRHFSVRDVYRIRRRQEEEYRRVLGDGFDREAASDFLDEAAAATVLRGALLAHEAERMGLRVTSEEVRSYLLDQLRAGNERIDDQVLSSARDYAEREYGTEKRFEEAVRDELLARKAARLISGSVAISDAEVADAVRYRRTQVSLAIVILDGGAVSEGTEVSEAEVQQLLSEEPERVREAYDERRDEFDQPEQVRARHVLIRVPPDADEAQVEEARERAQAALERIREGAAFEDVALELSEDPGSQNEGGDLGFFPRGAMVKPFEEVAFSLEPGVVSELVRSPHGFHVIRVEERRQATAVPFEEARERVARDLVRARKASDAARERAEELATAVREGANLVEAARERGLAIQRPDAFRRRPDGYVPAVGAAPEVMAAAFALTPDAPSDPRVHRVGEDKFVLIQLLEREQPSDEEIQAQLGEERERLLQERRNAVDASWLAARRDALAAEGQLVFDLSPLRR